MKDIKQFMLKMRELAAPTAGLHFNLMKQMELVGVEFIENSSCWAWHFHPILVEDLSKHK